MTLLPDNKKADVKVNRNMQIWQVILQSAKAFGLKPSEFHLKANKGPVDERIYNELVKKYVLEQINIERISEEILDESNPRRLISQSQGFIDKINSMMQRMSKDEEIVKEII